MLRYLCILISFLIFLGGCAAYPDVNRDRLESLPQHYVQFDVDLAWQVKSVGSQTLVTGELKNLRFQFMDDIEVWVAALDAAGKQRARSVSFIAPHELRKGEIAPFSLTLPVAVAQGSTLRFTYNYTGSDGGDDKGGFRTQSFLSDVR